MSNFVVPSNTPRQYNLDLKIEVEREIDGVGMGVLSDGSPFLNLRGLASMCGVDSSLITRITGDWINTPLKPREQKIRELVRAQGADDTIAFYAIEKNGTIHHAVPAAVCMAILEYYAFDAKTSNDKAAQSYRILARKGFNAFIYAQVGYNPTGASHVAWQQFHDRVSLAYHTVPAGYFSIFKEVADIIVTMIRAGAQIGKSFIPDISVGMAWAKYWKAENLEVVYGARIQYAHNYPDYFPQSMSNPQPAYCYPDDALAEFRRWARETYIPNQMPRYLESKVKSGELPAPSAVAAIEAFKAAPALPGA
ncbi:hypothetical protein [Sphingobium sp. DC-2]|uniref:hypothetical protein n=1 Tax=Sphingobium sp. DC-2 TaxID=1303256 RepID=UPI0004C372E5|nr:hypothetical protein [Sphingobium sp. DC-2]